MKTIQTRQNLNGNWWCNATIGYDYSFEGATIETAQNKMKELLDKKNISSNDCLWEPPKNYQHKEEATKSEIGYTPYRIDKGMI